ncbi:MAG: hypothetical protein JWR19_1989 [Pedosphaera sp.]|nr:hypothetical protein [Pedosphaera sp.]
MSCDDIGLHLSGWLRETRVTWEEVESIRAVHWMRWPTYEIALRNTKVFGPRVFVVLPYSRSKREQSMSAFPDKLRAELASSLNASW